MWSIILFVKHCFSTYLLHTYLEEDENDWTAPCLKFRRGVRNCCHDCCCRVRPILFTYFTFETSTCQDYFSACLLMQNGMGGCLTLDREESKARRRSEEIDKQLGELAKQERSVIKILLLGNNLFCKTCWMGCINNNYCTDIWSSVVSTYRCWREWEEHSCKADEDNSQRWLY
jgi:hypothetical protein